MTLESPASWAGPHLDFTARPAGASEKTATWDERSPKSLVGPMGTAIVIRHKANKSLVVATWEITNPDKWTEYRITYHQHREPGRSR
jgi:hypothetical protein